MKRMLIGSGAIKHHFPNFNRIPNDVDYIIPSTESKPIGENNVEYFHMDIIPFEEVINPNNLLTLKISHSIRPLKFRKHLHDIKFLLKMGCQVNETLLVELLSFWNEFHGKRLLPSFQKTNEEFFNDNVKRIHNHDDLHKHFAFDKKPKFESIKKDLNFAEVDEQMFNTLSFDDKVKIVLEEQFVIAYERYMVINSIEQIALNKAFTDVITRLFPEYISLFALKHANNFLTKEQLEIFKQKVNELST